MKIKFPSIDFRALFAKKNFRIIFSVVLSFIIWLVVMIKQNPIREQVFTEIPVTISLENTAAGDMGLGVVSDLSNQKFTVTISGPNYVVSSVKSTDFILTTSLTDINTPGTYSMEILPSRNSSKAGYTFKSVSPSTIDVTFDYIDTKEFTVTPKLVGVSAADGLIAEAPILSNAEKATITIKGPRSIMNQINSVATYAVVNKTLSETQSFESDVVLYDENEKVLYRFSADGSVFDKDDKALANSNLTLSFTSAKVTQPISKSKTVKVKPNFANLPLDLGADDISFKVDHPSVTIIGQPEIIDSIKEISLSAIDFRTVSVNSNSFEVSAVLQDGVKILDNIEFFTVTINTSNYVEKTFNISDIRCTGLKKGLSATTGSSLKNVKLCGPKNIMKSVKASDFYGLVTLEDKSEGIHTVDVVIKSDKFKTVWQVGNYSTAVTVK